MPWETEIQFAVVLRSETGGPSDNNASAVQHSILFHGMIGTQRHDVTECQA